MDDHHHKGILKRWDDDKGFGFIGTERSEVFFHIAALKNGAQRPRSGDVLHYQLHRGDDGKLQAVNVRIEDRNPNRPAARGASLAEGGAPRRWPGQLAVFALLLGGIGAWAYLDQPSRPSRPSPPTTQASVPSSRPAATAPVSSPRRAEVSCSGKVYCSEMSSCREARFYLRNCPGTKMDGDRDGVPCESQWCG
jgi:cold shock CspA family protein